MTFTSANSPGTYVPPDVGTLVKMDSVVSQLNRALQTYGAALGTDGGPSFDNLWNVIATPEGVYEAHVKNLGVWQQQVSDLDGPYRADVMNGSATVEGWFGTGKALYDTLQSEAIDVGTWTGSAIVSQATDASIADAKDLGKKVLVGAAFGGSAILLVAGILGVVYILIVFRR